MFPKGTVPKMVLAGTPKSPATQAHEEEEEQSPLTHS